MVGLGLVVGLGLAEADVGVVTGAVEVTRGAAGPLTDALMLGRVSRARAALRPPKVSSVTLTAATTHTATAMVATAAPGLARMLSQRARLIACANIADIANHLDPARRTTRRRYATASSAVAEQRLNTCSRSSAGSGASGSRRERAAGRRAPLP